MPENVFKKPNSGYVDSVAVIVYRKDPVSNEYLFFINAKLADPDLQLGNYDYQCRHAVIVCTGRGWGMTASTYYCSKLDPNPFRTAVL